MKKGTWLMSKSGSVELYKFGIVIAVLGIVILLLTLLDYLQDGKAESGSILGGVLTITSGALMYMSGRRSKGQGE